MSSERPRILIGGGQAFHGPTADRDLRVCTLLAGFVYSSLQNTVEIVTGGTEGIPDVFAEAWPGAHALDVVSDEHAPKYFTRLMERLACLPHDAYPYKRTHMLVGKSQLQRRIAMVAMPRIVCAIFIQGGKFSTHEMRLLHEKGIPIVPLWGGGGAAGGQQPYEDWSLPQDVATAWNEPRLLDTDPSTDPALIATAMTRCVVATIKGEH